MPGRPFWQRLIRVSGAPEFGVVAGTVMASEVVVPDANKDIGDFRNLDAVNIDAGASGTAGTLDVFPATAAKGKLQITVQDQTGNTTVTLDIDAMGQATVCNVPDPGAATCFFALSTAALTLAEVDALDGATAGTVVASKAVVVDSNKDISIFRNFTCTTMVAGASGTAGSVQIFPTTAAKGKVNLTCADQTGNTTVTWTFGAMATLRTITVPDPGADARVLLTTDTSASTATDATTAELTRIADVSARLISVGGTALAVTVALHSDKVIKLDHTAAASTCTLPDATGSGAVFRFIVTAVNTNNHVVVVPDASNTIKGSVNILDNDSNAQTAYAASGTDDTLTLNGTTTGGQIGDWIEFVDIAADTWAVRGQLVVPAGSNVADPFSATV